MKQTNLKDAFGLDSLDSTAWGDIQDKFWNDPKNAKWRARFLELLSLDNYDILTSVVPMRHQVDDSDRQEVIASGESKSLYTEKSGMKKSSAYNIDGFNKKVIVNGTNVRVSSFPSWMTKGYVYFFTDKGDTVLDPFAGHNSRATAVVETKRNYIGYDVAKYYVQVIKEKYEKLKLREEVGNLTINWQSSEKLNEKDNSVDFVFTSPPFWNAEGYDDDPRQIGGRLSKLGSDVSYEQFLSKYQVIINECYRVLKKGRHIGFNVEDLYDKGKLYTLSVDTVLAFKKAGFTMTDIVVTPYNSVAKSFKIQKITNQHFGKTHGYIIFGRK